MKESFVSRKNRLSARKQSVRSVRDFSVNRKNVKKNSARKKSLKESAANRKSAKERSSKRKKESLLKKEDALNRKKRKPELVASRSE